MDKAPHRIASHLGAIMYVIIEDTQKDRQTGSERERNGRDRFGRRSGQSRERDEAHQRTISKLANRWWIELNL